MNTSPFMDKQIMDLSSSSSSKDFIDLMNNSQDDDHQKHRGCLTGDDNGLESKKEEILPSYDFQPIRPTTTAGLSQSASNLPGSANSTAARVWTSSDSKPLSTSPSRNYGSLDSLEPAKFVLEKDRNVPDTTLLSEIDRTMKRHADNLLHVLEGVSARLTQLETRNRNLENLVDDLKVSVGNSHGSTDGKMRQLENILREVQNGVQLVKDKQEIVEAQLQLSKFQISKVDQQPETPISTQVDSATLPPAAAPQAPTPQLPTVSFPQPPASAAPPPALPHQSLPLPPPQPAQLSGQFPPPQQELYFPPPGQSQTQPPPNQPPYQVPPPTQPPQPAPVAPPHQPPYQPSPQPPQYSQQPPPQLPQHQPPSSGYHPEEPPFPPQTYPSNPPRQPPAGSASSQQYYSTSPLPSMFEGPSGRSNSGFPPGYSSEPYPYSGSASSQFGGTTSMKPPHMSGSGTGYPQLPTARPLPHALPMASGVNSGSSGSSSPRSGSRVPIDDVVDKVTSMGFPRDQVRATVRKLTENGQAVDLNVVLDKLMNGGEGMQQQPPPRGWLGGR